MVEYKSEIEAKRARIAQMRRERERKLEDKPGAGSRVASTSTRRASSRLPEDQVNEIFEELNLTERPSYDSLRPTSRMSEQSASEPVTVVIQSVFDIESSSDKVTKPKVESYSKQIQTDPIETEIELDEEEAVEEHEEPVIEEEIDETEAQEEDENVKADTPQVRIREADDELEMETGTEMEELEKFLNQSWKVIGRAMDDDYDILIDYGEKTKVEKDTLNDNMLLNQTMQFYSPTHSANRAITSIDWSSKFPELLASSHTEHNSDPTAPKGLVQIWNTHAKSRPEYIFHSQSDVLTVKFSPFEPNLVFGTAYNGQILTWDLRSGSADPILKSPLTGTGHAHPVYSLQITGTKNANNLITSSTDGTVCTWTSDLLAKPQDRLVLTNPAVARNDEVSPTCLNISSKHPTRFVIGTEEGNIYQCNRYDQAGARAGLDTNSVYKSHLAPITSIDFHSSKGSIDFGDYLLSSSLDWSVKLWKVGGDSTDPVLDFKRDDMVYDVQWSQHSPSVFACVDGSGYLELWDLVKSVEVPQARVKPFDNNKQDNFLSRPLNKLVWSPQDTAPRVAVGGLDGTITVFDAALSSSAQQPEHWSKFKHVLSSTI